MNAADMRETRAREQEMINRRAFAEQRAQSQDAATRSVWDAAMHGVGPDRIRALLNLAVAEAADAQAIIEGGGEEYVALCFVVGVIVVDLCCGAVVVDSPDIVLERVRPLEEIAAGVGTAPVSKAYWHVNCANELGESPLHVAAWRGHLAVVRALLQDGAEVNLVDSCASGITPLIESVRGGHREVVRQCGCVCVLGWGGVGWGNKQLANNVHLGGLLYAGQGTTEGRRGRGGPGLWW